MTFSFAKATKKTAKARIAFMGPSGSGKTKTALLVAAGLGKRVAVIDTENASAAKYAGDSGVPEFDVLCLESFSPETYVEAIHAAESAGYEVLVIDSLSHAWSGKDGALEQVDRAAKRSQSGNSYTAWRDVTPKHNALVDALVRCKCHLIVTMRTKTEYVLEEVTRNGKTSKQPRRVGLAPIQRDGMEYEFDVVADITLDHDLMVTKTRCSALDGAVVAKAGSELGKQLAAWLSDGEPVKTLKTVMEDKLEARPAVPAPDAPKEPEAPELPEDPHVDDLFPKNWPHDHGSWGGRPMRSAPFDVVLKLRQQMREKLADVEPGSRAAIAILDVIAKAVYWLQQKNPDPTGALPNDGGPDPIAQKYYQSYFNQEETISDMAESKLANYLQELQHRALVNSEQAERVHFYLLAAQRVMAQRMIEEAPEPVTGMPADMTVGEMAAIMHVVRPSAAELEALDSVPLEVIEKAQAKRSDARAKLSARAAKNLEKEVQQATGKN